MPKLLHISDEQIDLEFASFHNPSSPIRAIAECRRPNSVDTFDGEESVARYKRNAKAYVAMFGGAVNGLVKE